MASRLTRIAGARNYRFFHAPSAESVERLTMIIRIVYYNNYATYLVNRFTAQPAIYEVLTTVSQIPGCVTTVRGGAYRFPKHSAACYQEASLYQVPRCYTHTDTLAAIISVICPTIAAGVLSEWWLVRSYTRGDSNLIRGLDTDRTFVKAGTFLTGLLRHGAIKAPRFRALSWDLPRDSRYRDIRQPSGFTTHAAAPRCVRANVRGVRRKIAVFW